jgi:ABC-type sugar transport system ATPase subunit
MCILEKLMKVASKKQASLVKEARQLLQIPKSIYTDEKTYNKDPQVLLEHRQKIAELIEKFMK